VGIRVLMREGPQAFPENDEITTPRATYLDLETALLRVLRLSGPEELSARSQIRVAALRQWASRYAEQVADQSRDLEYLVELIVDLTLEARSFARPLDG
jgi:hypothetical protein